MLSSAKAQSRSLAVFRPRLAVCPQCAVWWPATSIVIDGLRWTIKPNALIAMLLVLVPSGTLIGVLRTLIPWRVPSLGLNVFIGIMFKKAKGWTYAAAGRTFRLDVFQ